MFESSTTGHLFRVLWVVVLAAVCLASLGPLPRAMASVPTCEITSDQEDQIVETHNQLRSTVRPTASNMRRLMWNQELADAAQLYASQCIVGHNENLHGSVPPYTSTYSYRHYRRIGENIDVLYECDGYTNYTEIIREWHQERLYYDFRKRKCNPLCTCDRYLQIVWAQTCDIGCAVAYCPRPTGYAYNNIYLLVCNYAPGPPSDYIYRRPYRPGDSCSNCGNFYTECENNLCYNSEGACMGSDPHFGIRLPEGSLLCYTFQGEQGSVFNIISNSQLEMNALFVPDSRHENNTWIGSIGITVYHNGRKMTSLKFTAEDQVIQVGTRVKLQAKTVTKLSFNHGKLTIVEAPRHYSPKYPRVGVEFLDSELHFTVAFVKEQHIDLLWHSIGETYEDTRGVVGQFFRSGVRIDQDRSLLYIPRRHPIPIIRRPVWDFMKNHLSRENECWTSEVPSNQGVGLIEGEWADYKVEDLLAIRH